MTGTRTRNKKQEKKGNSCQKKSLKGPTQKKTFEHTDPTYELCNAHNYSIVFKISIVYIYFLKIYVNSVRLK